MKEFIIQHPVTKRTFRVKQMFTNRFHGVKRRDPKGRKYLVVHHTAGNMAGDFAVLSGKTKTQVSVKYLVSDPGEGMKYLDKDHRLIIWQFLPDDVIGWSVGRTSGKYAHVKNYNSDSIEVSNRGNGKDPFEQLQKEAVEALVAYEERRVGQELVVLSHKEVAPGRKFDPHVSFPMARVKKFAAWVRRGLAPRR